MKMELKIIAQELQAINDSNGKVAKGLIQQVFDSGYTNYFFELQAVDTRMRDSVQESVLRLPVGITEYINIYKFDLLEAMVSICNMSMIGNLVNILPNLEKELMKVYEKICKLEQSFPINKNDCFERWLKLFVCTVKPVKGGVIGRLLHQKDGSWVDMEIGRGQPFNNVNLFLIQAKKSISFGFAQDLNRCQSLIEMVEQGTFSIDMKGGFCVDFDSKLSKNEDVIFASQRSSFTIDDLNYLIELSKQGK